MGQKIAPNLFRAYKRLSNISNNSTNHVPSLLNSVWYAGGSNYSKTLLSDHEIRTYLNKKIASSGIVKIIIRRFLNKTEIVLYVTRPGVVIGKGGSRVTELKQDLTNRFNLTNLKLDIQEFRDVYKSARAVAEELSFAIRKGLPYRRVAKSTLERVKYAGVKGVKIILKGRLNGAEIARTEKFEQGSVPRHTIDSLVDYHLVHCKTKTGILGIKVYLYSGDKLVNYSY